MRKILITILVMTLVGILAGGACLAGVPGSISYQGKLTNSEGQPVSDGPYQVQFKLYAEGLLFWTSDKQNVTTSGGVFTTQLTPLAASDLAGLTDVWMEIWVGSPPAALFPRTEFTSVPYALISGDSWSLLGNAGTTPGTSFLGTTDNQPLEFWVNNARALRLEPTSGTPNVIGGYSGNTVTADTYGATISGGGESDFPNSVTSRYGTVGGGYGNTASGYSATVGGGHDNTASGFGATVPGGYANTAVGNFSFAAGRRAKANHDGAFVWADSMWADFASTATNQFLIRASGGVGIGTSSPTNALSVAGNVDVTGNVGIGTNVPAAALDVNGLIRSRTGGFKFPDDTIQTTAASTAAPSWSLTGNADTTPGTNFIGTTDNTALEFKVNNTGGLRLEPTSNTPNIIGGYSGNTVTAGISGATISGGGSSGGNSLNKVTDHWGTVSGGEGNTVNDFGGTVAGGHYNTASGDGATVGGGNNNTASSSRATVGGGSNNIASGPYATVPGGINNAALGIGSFAAGHWAKANHDGTFVWADSTDADLTSTGANQFMARASGGVWFYSNAAATTGVVLAAGAGAWANASDRSLKANFASIDGKEILAKVAALPMSSWNYKSQNASIRHIGPVAQDFAAAFKVGEDDKYISTIDADGVALAAIQGLCQELKIRDAKIAQQQKQIDEIKALVAALVSKEKEKP